MKRVLLVSHELTVTGAPNSLLRQAKYFLSARFGVDVWTFKAGALAARYEEAGLAPRIVPNSRAGLKQAFEGGGARYDLIVCNTIRTYRAADTLQRYGAPVVWFIRETKMLDEDHWLNPDFARVFDTFYNLYTISEYNAAVVRDYNPSVRVIHNAVADSFKGFSPPAGHMRFGFIGSFMKVKGLDLLLDAFRRVRADFPGCTLSIAGAPRLKFGHALYAAERNAPGVIWAGEVQGEGKEAFFDAVDVLCVPSLDEPFGLTVLEGAMHGKPVITTDRTGAGFVVDEAGGGVVKAGDVQALAEKMRRFAQMDQAALRECSEHSRRRYLEFGTPEVERAAVLKMFEENEGRAPVVRGRLRLDEKRPFFHETRYEDGRRRFYAGGLRLFTVQGKGIRRRKGDGE